jgi:hypothetical protein
MINSDVPLLIGLFCVIIGLAYPLFCIERAIQELTITIKTNHKELMNNKNQKGKHNE